MCSGTGVCGYHEGTCLLEEDLKLKIRAHEGVAEYGANLGGPKSIIFGL